MLKSSSNMHYLRIELSPKFFKKNFKHASMKLDSHDCRPHRNSLGTDSKLPCTRKLIFKAKLLRKLSKHVNLLSPRELMAANLVVELSVL